MFWFNKPPQPIPVQNVTFFTLEEFKFDASEKASLVAQAPLLKKFFMNWLHTQMSLLPNVDKEKFDYYRWQIDAYKKIVLYFIACEENSMTPEDLDAKQRKDDSHWKMF